MKKTILIIMFLLLGTAVIQAKIITQSVEYFHKDQKLIGFLAYDDLIQGKRPGILVIHEWVGLNEYAKSKAISIAKLGYVGFAIDVYGDGKVCSDMKEAKTLSTYFKENRKLMRERAQRALDLMKKMPQVNPLKTASIGFCFGGTVGLELARSGAEILGTVSFHGNLATPNPQDAKNIKGKILVLHGADDPVVPLVEVNNFEKEMKEGNVDYDLIKYSKAVHAFTNPSGKERYNYHADKHSWKSMKLFFRDIFQEEDSLNHLRPLNTGCFVPDAELRTIKNEVVSLQNELSNKNAVLIFYRGSWCPYCNRHFAEIQKIEKEILNLGFEIYAISPDLPENLQITGKDYPIKYTLLSDSKAEAAKGFKIAFKVDQLTLDKYKEYGINLNKASGENHNLLPVPSVFVVKNNKIEFTYFNPDYKVRLNSRILLEVLKSLK